MSEKKQILMRRFKTFGREMEEAFGQEPKENGEAIVEVLRGKGLTYEEAYASLEYAYQKITYEANFMKLQ